MRAKIENIFAIDRNKLESSNIGRYFVKGFD
jgi:hypothetical protein